MWQWTVNRQVQINVPILQPQLHKTMEWIWVQAECTDPPTTAARDSEQWIGRYRQIVPILQTPLRKTLEWIWVQAECTDPPNTAACDSEQWTGRYRRSVPILQPPLQKTLEWIWVQAECTDPPIPAGWDIGVDLGTSRVYLSSNHSYTLLQSGYQGTSKVYLLPSLRWVSHWSK